MCRSMTRCFFLRHLSQLTHDGPKRAGLHERGALCFEMGSVKPPLVLRPDGWTDGSQV
jgi:hypothetical protein